jgi:Tfp pilus assembly protein PilF
VSELNDIRYITRGCLKIHNKNYDLAIDDLTKALTMDPQCDLARYNRAVCYQIIGEVSRSCGAPECEAHHCLAFLTAPYFPRHRL